MSDIAKANERLDEIIAESGDTVFCRACANRYGKVISIELNGEFTPSQLAVIAEIANDIDQAATHE